MTSSFSSKYISDQNSANYGMYEITKTDDKGNKTVEYMTRDQAFLAFCERVAAINDEKLKTVEKQLQDLSDKAHGLTQLIQQMQDAKANKNSAHDNENLKFKIDGIEGTKTVQQWFNYFGIKGELQDVNPDNKDDEWRNEWDMNITRVQGELDMVNNDVSKQMTEYDKYNNRMTKALDIAKSSLDQTSSANQGVIGNW